MRAESYEVVLMKSEVLTKEVVCSPAPKPGRYPAPPPPVRLTTLTSAAAVVTLWNLLLLCLEGLCYFSLALMIAGADCTAELELIIWESGS